ncbi:hypothetical protein FHR55_001635 [Xanthomonas arboricola]
MAARRSKASLPAQTNARLACTTPALHHRMIDRRADYGHCAITASRLARTAVQ